jgi:hypothetical protein
MAITPRLAATACAVAACAGALTGCRRQGEDDPVAAVKDYIVAAAIENNGEVACGYLTPGEQQAASQRTGGDGCREALGEGSLTLGRHHITSPTDLAKLHSSDKVDGNHASVTLGRGSSPIQFELVKATAAEKLDFNAPRTAWRISHGGLVVMPNTPPEAT